MSAIKGTLIPSSFISLRISGIPAKSRFAGIAKRIRGQPTAINCFISLRQASG